MNQPERSDRPDGARRKRSALLTDIPAGAERILASPQVARQTPQD